MALVSRSIKLLGPFGGYKAARFICKKNPRVLMYHRFSSSPEKGRASTEIFDEQVKYIKRWYNPVTVSEMAERHHLYSDTAHNKHLVCISVDDGYHDFYEFAFPILKKHGVVATFYITTGFVDGDIWLWPDQVSYFIDHSEGVQKSVDLGESSIEIGCYEESEKRVLFRKISDYLLSIPDENKHQCIKRLYDLVGLEIPKQPPKEYAAVNWEHLREMQEYGIEIGGHTVTHPSLGRVEHEQARSEILTSFNRLTEELGERHRTFCYPNGMPCDFNERVKEAVVEAGFIGAVKAFSDSGGVSDRFAIGRHVGGDDMFQFYKSVSGLELLGKQIRR